VKEIAPMRDEATALNLELIRFPESGPLSLEVQGLLTSAADAAQTGGARMRPFRRSVAIDAHPIAQPLVSCLMVTEDRPAQAQVAIECFRRQTWSNRELLVLDTSESVKLADWVEQLADPAIRCVRRPGLKATLGDLRNLSVEMAAGEWVCQWDDDDLYHPARIEAQFAVLSTAEADACLLLRHILWWPERARLAVTRQRAWEGTVLCRKSAMPQYPSLRRGEDLVAVAELMRSKRVVVANLPELYVYVAHGTNTWNQEHFETIWQGASRQYEGSRYGQALAQLSFVKNTGDSRAAIGGFPAFPPEADQTRSEPAAS
jgi:hypothetical protein